jgi:hypothetical protein
VSGITGVERLYKMADKLPEVVDKALSDELENAFSEPIASFRSEVDDAIGTRFPTGYSGTFEGSWNILAKVNAGGGSVSARLRGTAHGRAKKRDSAALNRGVLRHKTWGRLPWHTQAIPARFWDDPADRLIARMRSKLAEVVEKAAKKIEAQL